MLRVELHDASSTSWLRLEGRFVSAFALETKAMLVRCRLPWKLVVDLSDVTFVDADGEAVLLWLASIGAHFVAGTLYTLDICRRLGLPLLNRGRRARKAY